MREVLTERSSDHDDPIVRQLALIADLSEVERCLMIALKLSVKTHDGFLNSLSLKSAANVVPSLVQCTCISMN